MTEVNFCSPEYTVEDRQEELVITITAPLAKPKEAALVLENGVFTFDSSPYLLKIKLQHAVSDRFSDQAYDSATGTYKIKLKKNGSKLEEEAEEEEGDNEELLEYIKKEDTSAQQQNGRINQHYGFANKYSKMFGKLYNEFSEIINLPDPDHTDVDERRRLRIEDENEKWSDDHYLADTMETDHLEFVFEYKPPWKVSPLTGDLNNDEQEMLMQIRNNIKIEELSDENKLMCEFQIIDILFGYAYNKRTTEGDNTVESGWTINKLSSTLSWFEVFKDLKMLLTTCYRRSLIYPLYRNWNLAQTVHKDVVDILKIGPKQITRCLLEVMEIFNESENRYILNTLYVNSLCDFASTMTIERSLELSKEVEKVKVTKYEVNNDLPLIEIAAHLALEEEVRGSEEGDSKIENIINKIEKLALEKDASEDSSEYNDSDSSEFTLTQSSENED